MKVFFSAGDLNYHKECLKKLFEAASSNKIWSKENPGDLLYEFTLLESVINSAHLLVTDKKYRIGPDLQANNFFDPSSCLLTETNWNNFPRLLSFREFSNPYETFKHFFKYVSLTEWKQELQFLVDHALVNYSLFEAGIEMNTLFNYFQLTKLIEAAHIINSSNRAEKVKDRKMSG